MIKFIKAADGGLINIYKLVEVTWSDGSGAMDVVAILEGEKVVLIYQNSGESDLDMFNLITEFGIILGTTQDTVVEFTPSFLYKHREDRLKDQTQEIAAFAERQRLLDLYCSRIDDVFWYHASVRLLNALREARIIYVGDIICLTEQQLISLPNVGRKSFREAKDELERLGLKLGTVLDFNWDILRYKTILKEREQEKAK